MLCTIMFLCLHRNPNDVSGTNVVGSDRVGFCEIMSYEFASAR